jgi:beta-xylosidase
MDRLNGEHTYRNPIIDADLPDPDAIRVGDRYVMIASSFNRAPGLPVYVSTDLVNWERAADALPRGNEPAAWFDLPRHGQGVWAPSIRHRNGIYYIVYPDPDQGILVVTAPAPEGPWSAPHLLLGGLGLIDPCPLWDDDGTAYLVHGWANSRAGKKNILTIVPVDELLRETTGTARDVIDGADIAGWGTIEGPKFYKRDGWYWIFAPAGGVATGWQAVFRSREVFGPYEERNVLEQGSTPVNGPHQGAWVTAADGRDWFLHFQDRGPFGRVVHLQPMAWGDDGWPVMGKAVDGGPSEPVLEYPSPHGTPQGYRTVARSDDFADGAPGATWAWQANPADDAIVPGGPGLRIRSGEDSGNLRTLTRVLGQPIALDGGTDTRAGLTVLGYDYLWAGLVRGEHGIDAVVAVRTRGDMSERTVARIPAGDEIEVAIECAADASLVAEMTVDGRSLRIDPDFVAAEGQWIGAELAIFAGHAYGAEPAIATFSSFRVDLAED